ncbi:hypothetical protein [Bacillus weihaiensis]|uniref:Replication-relaxation n=1 Tax=Bacillus weihaiensis TaxID=1547283 RepID=A0A1L3MXZ7_9BACI|nr:hypothetical protein [Bacillus weihaiensis]APH07206.1 hypothetical protein A9C19_20690 [Bacillus weihaiensis]
MPLTKRDKAIIEDLNRFRVMDRDSIAHIHFKTLKNPNYAANNVLLRLLREGHLQRSTAFVPYVYFGPDVNMKKNSAKIGHFLAIVEVYKDILKYGNLHTFLVEPKYGEKGMAEPDIFCIFRRTPFFIEVQKTIYSEKQMNDKLNRYRDLYNSGIITREEWQPPEKPVFPHILIISEQRYAIDRSYPFKVIQAQSFTKFMDMMKPKEEKKTQHQKSGNGAIKIKVQ